MRTVLLVTHIPSLYQVDLFNTIAASEKITLTVLYVTRSDTSRSWVMPDMAHDHRVIGALSERDQDRLVGECDLAIFAGYNFPGVRRLIAARRAIGKPWLFWGERMGFTLPSWIGTAYRMVSFPALRSKQVPIWGIGGWAVDKYKAEFGHGRYVLNVPYFSNLSEFLKIDRSEAKALPRRILYSGSLIHRKGVDLLANTFVHLAAKYPDLTLAVAGEGPLRGDMQTATKAFSDRVQFVGFKQMHELPSQYAQADVLCAPSRHDGWGLIVPEALAAGLLVITTDHTGAGLDLVDEHTGWLVPAGSQEALTAAVEQAINVSPEDRQSRIARGRVSARSHHVDQGAQRVLTAIEASLSKWHDLAEVGHHRAPPP